MAILQTGPLIRFWSPVPAVIAAGILSTYYFGITGTFWAVTGEFTRWGGQLLQLLGVHSEQWGYYQLIHLEGSPLTRIDGRMIIGMFGGCPPPRCGRITSNCACHAAGSALRRPWRAASSPGSAHGWRWAATGGLLHRHSAVLPARGCLPSPPPSALVWRPLHAAAPFSHPGKMQKCPPPRR